MFNTKKQINRANAIISIIVVIVLVFFINILSAQIFGRWDVTENNDYSISDTTKDILKNLDDVVNIKAYFTEELPGYLLVKNQDVRDVLAEYEAMSRGNIIVTFLDPSKDAQIEQEARSMGIPTLQFNVVEKDKYEVMNGYIGIVVFYGDKKEIIPIVENTQSLEYDLTAAISKVVREKIPSIAFLTGKGALTRDSDMKQVDQELQRQYNVLNFDITSTNMIPEKIDTLIIAGVKEELTLWEKYVIDQFLMRGGDILFMTEGVFINPNDLTVKKMNTGIEDLLLQYGVQLNNNLALDMSNEMAGFRTDQVQFFSPYPFWIKILKTGFNPESGIVNKLESLVLAWASTIDILEDKLTNATEKTVLVSTTEKAWLQNKDNEYQLNPRLISGPEQGTQASYILGAMLSGHFESLFSKDNLPKKDYINTENMSQAPLSTADKDEFLESTEEGRIIVIGDSEFALDINLPQFPSNGIFFLNLVDSLSSDEALITIRSKSVTDRPLKLISDKAKNVIRWSNIIGIPIIFALYGLVRFVSRKKSRSIL